MSASASFGLILTLVVVVVAVLVLPRLAKRWSALRCPPEKAEYSNYSAPFFLLPLFGEGRDGG